MWGFLLWNLSHLTKNSPQSLPHGPNFEWSPTLKIYEMGNQSALVLWWEPRIKTSLRISHLSPISENECLYLKAEEGRGIASDWGPPAEIIPSPEEVFEDEGIQQKPRQKTLSKHKCLYSSQPFIHKAKLRKANSKISSKLAWQESKNK